MKAYLVLEDGSAYKGESFGAEGESFGEMVFNTSMTGYQEILTDPSYKGQIVMMTYPLIGNYGVNDEDVESRRPWAEGFVIKELSGTASNYRKKATLGDYMRKHKIVGIQGVDTRAITRKLRTKGAMKCAISTEEPDEKKLLDKVKGSPGLLGRDLVKEVTCKKPFDWGDEGAVKPRFTVVAIDCGTKLNIFRNLSRIGCRVKVLPASATAEEVLALKPDGLFLSNGPGDPEGVPYHIEAVRKLIGKLPIFGICLGHQILGLAFGGKTYKLKFGHHGGNHPVMDLRTKKVDITSQNHGFAVDMDSIPDKDVVLTHINLYDRTVEGMEHKKLPVFSVQYHPEACPGPHDAEYLFDKFATMMSERKDA
ncbi:MAG: glutamine-hydrolyzing carbamoyl-phosphate synthase small subunit [Candidatus Omnitrophica bacterium]|nr:glutamine-hydrolyzing carbamoyl-phosphate synthase small subunit [Candidatus Omnitrophota bacterium]MDD5310217.1 glutamine-hydrolyzing carbamoyl-phosphate synthase small subunit [Candidatus Omnitrophota bacterium]